MKIFHLLLIIWLIYGKINKTLEHKLYKEFLDGKEECFLEKLASGQEIFTKYNLINFLNKNNETNQVKIEIKFLKVKNEIVNQIEFLGNSNNITFFANKKGKYELCYKMKGLERRFLMIIIDKEDLNTKVLFQKSDTDNYKAKLDKIEDEMNEARKVQIYFKIREEQFYQTLQTIEFRLFWSQSLFILGFISLLFCQQFLLKKFLDKKF